MCLGLVKDSIKCAEITINPPFVFEVKDGFSTLTKGGFLKVVTKGRLSTFIKGLSYARNVRYFSGLTVKDGLTRMVHQTTT